MKILNYHKLYIGVIRSFKMGLLPESATEKDIDEALRILEAIEGEFGCVEISEGPDFGLYFEVGGNAVLHSRMPLWRSESAEAAGRHIIFKRNDDEVGHVDLGILAQLRLAEIMRVKVPPSAAPRLVDDLMVVGDFARSAKMPAGYLAPWLRSIKASEQPIMHESWLQMGYLNIATDRSRLALPFNPLKDRAIFTNEDTQTSLEFCVEPPYNVMASTPRGKYSIRGTARQSLHAAFDRILPQAMYAIRGARAAATPLDKLEKIGERVGARVMRGLEPEMYAATVR